MSILDDEDKLLNFLPTQLWLEHNINYCNAKIQIEYSNSSVKVNILNIDPAHDTLVSIHQDVESIPDNIHFNLVEGDLIVSGSKIKNLKGFPRIIKGGLYLHKCSNLENLLGCPDEIHGEFKITNCNNLINFIEFPMLVSETFECSNCKNLVDARFNSNKLHKIGSFDSHKCPKLIYIPEFPPHFYGFVDISSCESLKYEELKKLPDVTEGNLFIFNTCEKYTNKQYKTFIQHSKDYEIAVPSWYEILVVENEMGKIIKFVEVRGELYINEQNNDNKYSPF